MISNLWLAILTFQFNKHYNSMKNEISFYSFDGILCEKTQSTKGKTIFRFTCRFSLINRTRRRIKWKFVDSVNLL